jgi:hypothetical protein
MKKGMQEMMKQQPAGAAAADWRGRIGSYWIEMGGDSLRSFEKRKPNLPGKGRISAALRVGVRSGAGETNENHGKCGGIAPSRQFLGQATTTGTGGGDSVAPRSLSTGDGSSSGDLLKRGSSVRSAPRSSIQQSLCIWITGLVKAKVALAQLT